MFTTDCSPCSQGYYSKDQVKMIEENLYKDMYEKIRDVESVECTQDDLKFKIDDFGCEFTIE